MVNSRVMSYVSILAPMNNIVVVVAKLAKKSSCVSQASASMCVHPIYLNAAALSV